MKYQVIVADPCWSYEDKLRRMKAVGTRRSADSHYVTMSLEEIMALPVQSIAADTCILALWCPNSLLFSHGYPTLTAWGFTYKQKFEWVKTTNDGSRARPGMGRMFRNATEPALIGVRGKPKCLDKAQLGVAMDPWLGHSKKPDTLQRRLEKMFAGPRAELFARRDLSGWTCTGLECPSTLGVSIQEWLAAESCWLTTDSLSATSRPQDAEAFAKEADQAECGRVDVGAEGSSGSEHLEADGILLPSDRAAEAQAHVHGEGLPNGGSDSNRSEKAQLGCFDSWKSQVDEMR